MRKIYFTLIVLFTLLFSTTAFAGGAAPAASSEFDWENDSNIKEVAEQFILSVGKDDFQGAYNSAGDVLRDHRTLTEFTDDMKEARFDLVESVKWVDPSKWDEDTSDEANSAIPALPANGGYKLRGSVKMEGFENPVPIYLHLQGDAHIKAEDRSRKWTKDTKWTIMDYRSSDGLTTRFSESRFTTLDWFLMFFSGGLLIGFLGLCFYYVKGLWGAPRELYLLYFTKVTEYSAYGAAASIMVPFLQNDVLLNGQPLGDTNGYLYYTVWTLSATVITIMVGAVCDTIGVKKCLLIGAVALGISRFFMPLTQDVFWVTLLGFIPLAIGFAITGPVLKVGIKKFTTMKQSTLGFGLFYTLMNVGFALGAEIADYFRNQYGDSGGTDLMGIEFTTYQLIILVGFVLNIPDFLAVVLMRDGAEMSENGLILKKEETTNVGKLKEMLQDSKLARFGQMKKELSFCIIATLVAAGLCYLMISVEVHEWKVDVIPVGKYIWALVATVSFFSITGILYAISSMAGTSIPSLDVVMKSVRDATEETVRQLKENFQERPFWIYMGMLGILTFVRLTFYIFHLMFPTYAIRVFGADFPVASIFGTLNPVMIIFLVPLISIMTVKVRSYTMLLWGTGLSSASVFLCFMPEAISSALADSWFGVWIFDYWLEAPIGNQDPFLMSLVVFIMVFTVGEAIWSPRLMQFSAEIAPRGKEGAYIALAMLPYFLGKAGAGVLSEQMTTRYFNSEQVIFPSHDVAWLWIGGMAALSPIGLIIFRGVFARREEEAIEEAKLFAEESKRAMEAEMTQADSADAE